MTLRVTYVAPEPLEFLSTYAEVVEGLRANHVYISVCAPVGDDESLRGRFTQIGVVLKDLPAFSPRFSVRDVAQFSILVTHFSEWAPSLVHVLNLRAAPAAAAAARVCRVPKVAVSTSEDSLGSFAGRGLRKLRDFAGKSAPIGEKVEEISLFAFENLDLIICEERAAADRLADRGVTPSKLKRLDNGLGIALDGLVQEGERVSLRSAARVELGLSDARFVVGLRVPDAASTEAAAAFARELRQKNQYIQVVATFEELVPRAGGAAGNAPGSRRGPSTEGVLVMPNSPDFLNALDVFVALDDAPATRRAVMQAACARVPAVVGDSAPWRAIVRHDETGKLARTEAERVAAVRALLDNPILREELGARARQLAVRLFDRQLQIHKLFGFYDGLFGAGNQEPAHLTVEGAIVPESYLKGYRDTPAEE